jgi:hypothetical protein
MMERPTMTWLQRHTTAAPLEVDVSPLSRAK